MYSNLLWTVSIYISCTDLIINISFFCSQKYLMSVCKINFEVILECGYRNIALAFHVEGRRQNKV